MTRARLPARVLAGAPRALEHPSQLRPLRYEPALGTGLSGSSRRAVKRLPASVGNISTLRRLPGAASPLT
jgi:hypothetical protein